MGALNEIIFENRNKEYGAYKLREEYSLYLKKALLTGLGIFILLFGGAFTYLKYGKVKALNMDEGTTIDLTPEPKTPEKPKEIITPPPAKLEEPEPQNQIKFFPPEAKIDESVINETPPPGPEELEKAIISDKTIKGEEVTSVFAIPPAPIETKIINIDQPMDDKPFTAVEQMPDFPGGLTELYKFLNANINYPSAAQKSNTSGRVVVNFVVNEDGTISNLKLLKGIGFGCDEESYRVIKKMPKWNPGKQNGKAVKVYYSLPILFKLE